MAIADLGSPELVSAIRDADSSWVYRLLTICLLQHPKNRIRNLSDCMVGTKANSSAHHARDRLLRRTIRLCVSPHVHTSLWLLDPLESRG